MKLKLFQSLEEIDHFMNVQYAMNVLRRVYGDGKVLYIFHDHKNTQHIAWVKYKEGRIGRNGYYLEIR